MTKATFNLTDENMEKARAEVRNLVESAVKGTLGDYYESGFLYELFRVLQKDQLPTIRPR